MVIDKSSPAGNAYAIMGAVFELLRQADRLDDWPESERRMMSGDYDNLCTVATEVTHGSITFTDTTEDSE